MQRSAIVNAAVRGAAMIMAAPLAASALAQNTEALAARADSVLRAAERGGFSGVVRIEKDGAVILERGYGLANRAERIAFTPATVVQIGSNTKDFTVVALLQLFERGRLTLHDSIGKYFRNVPADKRGITIRHLMDHTAGLPRTLGGDFDLVGRAELIDNAMRASLLSPPGAKESYSNTGYSLLAAIIEQVSGTTYDLYVRDHILAPLGMTRTGSLLPKFAPRDVAHGYRADGSDAGIITEKPHAPDGPYWNLRGNGGMLSTVGDMSRFYTALFESERLMRASTRALHFNPGEQIGLVGSDLVSYFAYERDPQARLEMYVASTNAAYRAPMVRRELSRVLAETSAVVEGGAPERRVVIAGATPAQTARETESGVTPQADATVKEFVSLLNRSDSSALHAFIEKRFAPQPDGPPVGERVVRLMTFRARAGTLTLGRVASIENGVEAHLSSPNEGAIVMRFEIEPGGNGRIRAIRLQVGTG